MTLPSRVPIAALVLLTVSMPWVFASAHDDDHPHPKRVPAGKQFAPSPLPDRVVLTWSEDPTSTMDISWRTDISVHHPFVEYAVAEASSAFVANAVRVQGETTPFTSDLGTCHYHNVTLRELTPNTKYVYRAGDGANWTEWFHFRTANEDHEPFSFVYFGDAQNDVRSHWSRVIREAHADAPRASFLLHAGDLVNVPESDAEWGEWFGAGGWLNAMTPSIATPGNHEYARDPINPQTGPRHLTRHWRPQFSFPLNGPEGLEETAYYLDYQGVRIISMNSNEELNKQSAWLDDVLSETDALWTIITFHHPVFSASRGRDNPELRMRWKPIFDHHGVDLVLQGHDHAYARTGLDVPTNLDTGLNIRDGRTVYVVSVSGPKMYTANEVDYFSRAASGVQLYQIIHIDDLELSFEARLATGELYDAFTLTKDENGDVEMTERIPNSPPIFEKKD